MCYRAESSPPRPKFQWTVLEAKLKALEMALNVDDVGLISLMMEKLIPAYTPSDEIVDWVYLEQKAEELATDAPNL